MEVSRLEFSKEFLNRSLDWVFLDTSALIKLIDNKVWEEFCAKLKSKDIPFYSISLVQLELMNTKEEQVSILRNSSFARNRFELKLMRPDAHHTASRIQLWIKSYNSNLKGYNNNNKTDRLCEANPGAVDLCIAAECLELGGGTQSLLLLTENVKDFPYPLFLPVAYLSIITKQKGYVLYLLRGNREKLDEDIQI